MTSLISQIQKVRGDIVRIDPEVTCEEWCCSTGARPTLQIELFYEPCNDDGMNYFFCTKSCCANFLQHDSPVYHGEVGYKFCSPCSRFILLEDKGVKHFVDAPKDFAGDGQICLRCYNDHVTGLRRDHKKRERDSKKATKMVAKKGRVVAAKKKVAKSMKEALRPQPERKMTYDLIVRFADGQVTLNAIVVRADPMSLMYYLQVQKFKVTELDDGSIVWTCMSYEDDPNKRQNWDGLHGIPPV